MGFSKGFSRVFNHQNNNNSSKGQVVVYLVFAPLDTKVIIPNQSSPHSLESSLQFALFLYMLFNELLFSCMLAIVYSSLPATTLFPALLSLESFLVNSVCIHCLSFNIRLIWKVLFPCVLALSQQATLKCSPPIDALYQRIFSSITYLPWKVFFPCMPVLESFLACSLPTPS